MSAGGLSYSGIVGYGKVTLPSVSGGFGSMNILRDPPKGVYTRRRDKVTDTSLITDMIDQSTDRSCEAIQVYGRGMNPMVSVDYSNFGNNGTRTGTQTATSGRTQAYLPYRIVDSFRPPVLRQENLQPLSRLPRTWTYAYTNPEFPDFSKTMRNCPPKTIVEDPIRVCARPTAVLNIEQPLVEPFEVRYVIQNPIKVEGHSGIRTIDRTMQEVDVPSKGINEDVVHSSVQAKPSQVRQFNTTELSTILDTDRYTSEGMYKEVNTRPSASVGGTLIEVPTLQTREALRVQCNTQKGIDQGTQNWMHPQRDLERTLPSHSAYVNTGRPDFSRESEVQSRTAHLTPKPQYGGFDGRATLPQTQRTPVFPENIVSGKNELAKRAFSQFHGRYANNPYELRA